MFMYGCIKEKCNSNKDVNNIPTNTNRILSVFLRYKGFIMIEENKEPIRKELKVFYWVIQTELNAILR